MSIYCENCAVKELIHSISFQTEQDQVTKQRIAEAEERIRKAEEKIASGAAQNGNDDATADADESKNGVDAATNGVEKLNVANGGDDKAEA